MPDIKKRSECEWQCSNTPILEGRISYFDFFSNQVREMYPGGGINYGLTTSVPIWRELNFWGAVDYFTKGGTMIGINHSTRITFVPITVGFKYLYSVVRWLGIYGGAGFKYYFASAINRSPALNRTIFRTGPGAAIETGAIFCINKHFTTDLFANFSYAKISGPSHTPTNVISTSMQLSGWNVGAGLGYKF